MTKLFESRPFIIAECGSNWRTFDECLGSIAVAKASGADAVKFQAFNYESLYGLSPVGELTEVAPGEFEAEYSELVGTLPLEWLPTLKAKADEVGVEFLCTAFSPELLAAVDPYVEVHKIASSDAAWPQMLEAVARTGKPILISFNSANRNDERRCDINAELAMNDAIEWVPMLCTASYPADFCDLSEIGDYFRGFSDHTLGYTATVEAARLGAIVIEKHFTAFPDLDTPDRPHSLTPAQFKRMVDIIRRREVESEEGAMYLRANRRLIATVDVGEGEALRYGETFGAYRSLVDDTRGLSPFDWEKVEGRRATRAIKRGEAIGEGDFG